MRTSLAIGCVAIGFAATMIAFWLFSQPKLLWGAYFLAVALVSLLVFIGLRASRRS